MKVIYAIIEFTTTQEGHFYLLLEVLRGLYCGILSRITKENIDDLEFEIQKYFNYLSDFPIV